MKAHADCLLPIATPIILPRNARLSGTGMLHAPCVPPHACKSPHVRSGQAENLLERLFLSLPRAFRRRAHCGRLGLHQTPRARVQRLGGGRGQGRGRLLRQSRSSRGRGGSRRCCRRRFDGGRFRPWLGTIRLRGLCCRDGCYRCSSRCVVSCHRCSRCSRCVVSCYRCSRCSRCVVSCHRCSRCCRCVVSCHRCSRCCRCVVSCHRCSRCSRCVVSCHRCSRCVVSCHRCSRCSRRFCRGCRRLYRWNGSNS